MGDRVLQNGPHLVHRTICALAMTRKGRLSGVAIHGLIEDVGRNMVGMRNKSDSHPALDRLIAIIIPIDRATDRAESMQTSKTLWPTQTQRPQANVANGVF